MLRLCFSMVIIHGYMGSIVSESYEFISQEVVLHPCRMFNKLTFEREAQIKLVVIKLYHTEDGILNV